MSKLYLFHRCIGHYNYPHVIPGQFTLSTQLIMSIGHHKEIRKLTFRALALPHSKLICYEEGLMLKMSAFKSPYGGQFTLSNQLIKPIYLQKLSTALGKQTGRMKEQSILLPTPFASERDLTPQKSDTAFLMVSKSLCAVLENRKQDLSL